MEQPPPVNVPYIDYQAIFSWLYDYFSRADFSTWPAAWHTFLLYYKFFATIATFFFAVGIFYATARLAAIRHKESLMYNAQLPQTYDLKREETELNKKWERVLLHVESANENDWKVAIMEADIILNDILDAMGYQGESIGEKLKRVEPGELQTVDQAWEAHKVRNVIAHQGADFVLNQREAKRIISLYQAVLEEFQSRA